MSSNPHSGFTPEMRARSLEVRRAKAADKYAKYLKGLEQGLRIGQAAEAAGLVRTSIEEKRRKDPEFAAAEKRAEAAFADSVETVVLESAMSGNMPAAFKWLEHRANDRWAPPKQVVRHEQALELEVGENLEKIMRYIGIVQGRGELSPPVIDVDPIEE